MNVLIIGGTGTLGSAILPVLLSDPRIERIRVLSRGEHKQVELASQLNNNRIDWLIGDVRDRDRIVLASEGCSQIYLFAAVKSVDKAEYDPMEAVLTNIMGAYNTIYAARLNKIQKVLLTSSDKASDPVNCYGATKLVAEKLFIQANIGRHWTRYSVVRFGNQLGSNGSVVQKWRAWHNLMTDPDMTRFWIHPKDAASFVYKCMTSMEGGELFIPKMKSTTMKDLWEVVMGPQKYTVIGDRPGEKKHECLISPNETELVTDLEWCWVKWPSHHLFPVVKRGQKLENGRKLKKEGFTSLNADRFTFEEMKKLCQ
jgi:UDP-N-acetylglucosamine 4,6-dehydratase